MATPRKRSSRYTKPAEEVTEKAEVEEFLDVVSTEVFETISQTEESVEPEKPFVEESIAPTPDEGPRFVEEAPAPPTPVEPALAPRPKLQKRHARNTPRFSRTVK